MKMADMVQLELALVGTLLYSVHLLYWNKSTNTDTVYRPLSLLALLVQKYKY